MFWGKTSKFPPSNHKLLAKVHRIIQRDQTLVCDLCRCFTNLSVPSACTLHRVIQPPPPQQMVQMALCDLSHIFHKQATNVSQQVFVILLWGILMYPLTPYQHLGSFLREVLTFSVLGDCIYELKKCDGVGQQGIKTWRSFFLYIDPW